ncbi:AAA family ATPase [uncultured Methylobacterium sp.]|jgi:ATP-dependent Lon protease|uniref:AAA family ATPase n=1 Tax=uncultured Methylobacterium sp. TaxID=157278 RepID=UPI00263991BB|nr:AAA family ATPase [uncultured Methylobacterium sp.]
MSKMNEHFARMRQAFVMSVRRNYDTFANARKPGDEDPISSTLELLSGREFPDCDYRNDVRDFLDPILGHNSPHRLPRRLTASLEAVRDNPTVVPMRIAERSCMLAVERSAHKRDPMLRETATLVVDTSERLAVWLAAAGCQRAAARCAVLCHVYLRDRQLNTYPDIISYGLMRSMLDYLGAASTEINPRYLEHVQESRHAQLLFTEGMLSGILHVAGVVQDGLAAGPHDKHDPDAIEEAPLPPVDLADLDHLDDDRAGIVRDPPKAKVPTNQELARAAIAALPQPAEPSWPGMVVIGDVSHVRRSGKLDADPAKDVEPIAQKRLPLVTVPDDLPAVRAELVAEFPHVARIVDRLLTPLAGQETVRMPPVLLWGPPGGGKTRFARRLGEVLELQPAVLSMAGITDSTPITGTPRGWSTANFGIAVRELLKTRIANPLIVVDEGDKIGTSRHNGNACDALINLLGTETSERYRDVYLQADVNASRIQWIITANSLDTVPRALVDRCLVLRLDEPGPQHLRTLATSILADVRADRGLDEMWAPGFDGVEWAALEEHWPGGSLRALRRLIETVLDARDAGPRQ